MIASRADVDHLTSSEARSLTDLKNMLLFIAMGWCTWVLQRRYGDWIHHNVNPNSWKHRVWWSLCDQEGGCCMCSNADHSFFEL